MESDFFKSINLVLVGAVAFFARFFYMDTKKELKEQSEKFNDLKQRVSVIENDLCAKIDKLEEVNKVRFDNIHSEFERMDSNFSKIESLIERKL